MWSDELVTAVEDGDVETVRAAIFKDPSLVHATRETGDTLLHYACWQKQPAIVELMVASGADVNARGDNGYTPLHYALQNTDDECVPLVALLLGHGADPSIEDDFERNAEAMARIEVWEAKTVERVVALFHSPLPLPRSVWEPLWHQSEPPPKHLEIRLQDPAAMISIRPYRQAGAPSNELWGAVTVGEHSVASGWSTPFDVDQLARFLDGLRGVANGGEARFEAPVREVRIVVRQRDAQIIATAETSDRSGPPGSPRGPFKASFVLSAADLAELTHQVEAVLAQLDALPVVGG